MCENNITEFMTDCNVQIDENILISVNKFHWMKYTTNSPIPIRFIIFPREGELIPLTLLYKFDL